MHQPKAHKVAALTVDSFIPVAFQALSLPAVPQGADQRVRLHLPGTFNEDEYHARETAHKGLGMAFSTHSFCFAAAPICWGSKCRNHCLVCLNVGPVHELNAVGDGLEHLVKCLTDGLGLAW